MLYDMKNQTVRQKKCLRREAEALPSASAIKLALFAHIYQFYFLTLRAVQGSPRIDGKYCLDVFYFAAMTPFWAVDVQSAVRDVGALVATKCIQNVILSEFYYYFI